MGGPFTLSQDKVALLVVDVQERLYSVMDQAAGAVHKIVTAVKGFQELGLPIVVTEQYPRGLGPTVQSVRDSLGKEQKYLTKTTFSCLGDPEIRTQVLSMSAMQWVVVGFEGHVCVLYTAKDLLTDRRQVVVVADAIASRVADDVVCAKEEMRYAGVRVSSLETVLFELVGDAASSSFKAISRLVR